ncbi:MAG: hypothetical protein JW917_09035 [Ignavibacteria bacterium]|nr:hypothetical protein [Ignavibacteria bacterium]
MKNFTLTFFVILFIFLTGTSFVSAEDFPGEWLGKWEGKLNIKTSSAENEVDMSLEIIPFSENRWKWIIIYGSGNSKIERAYELIADDLSRGLFKLDEKNEIILDMLFRNNTFYSVFSVSPNLIFSEYRLENGKLYFKVISSDITNLNITGTESENSAIVNSYVIHNTQTAVLEKK